MKRRSNASKKNHGFNKKKPESDLNATLLDFETDLKASVSALIRNLLDVHQLPSDLVYEIVAQFEAFISIISEGLKTNIGPLIEVGKEGIFNQFISAIESSFGDVVAQLGIDSINADSVDSMSD